MSNLPYILLCLACAYNTVTPDVNFATKEDGSVYVNLTVMTWNILAPIWVNRSNENAKGVDLNLLDWDIRLKLITKEILERNPDILTLQEVQEDVLDDLSESIKKNYKIVAFVPNKVGFWKSYLSEGMDYVKNGVATFYKPKKFGRVSHNSFKTSINGSFALTSILYPRIVQFRSGQLFGYGHPIIVINCHQQAKYADINLRVAQATVILQEAIKTRKTLTHETPGSLPSVIIAGDINSEYPRPGFMIFKDNGYLDALETVGDSTRQTYFYPRPKPSPAGDEGYTIDHVFISADDVKDGRIRLLSADIPDVSSDNLSEVSYVKKLTNMTISNLRQQEFDESAKILSTIFKITKDEKEFDNKVNRVLRIGSDHMLLFVKLQQQNRYCYFVEHGCLNKILQQVIFP